MSTQPGTTDPREADRQALRGILADVQAGINERDLERILRHVGDDAVVTYQNADVSRGKAEIGAYFNHNFMGSNAIIKRLIIRGEIASPAVFIGDAAVAHGTSHDDMELTSGRKFALDGKWSSTLLKQEGNWRIVCLHFSTNVLDNSVLNGVKKLVWMGAVSGFVLGSVLAWAWAHLPYLG
jgi:ketosteroid isomerase-like protein